MSDPPRCETCRFFDRSEYSDNGGLCRRYPPTVYNDEGDTDWPWTREHHWCGEHQPREE
jgi:hypothetical protein